MQTITVKDFGNSGAGGPLQASFEFPITIDAAQAGATWSRELVAGGDRTVTVYEDSLVGVAFAGGLAVHGVEFVDATAEVNVSVVTGSGVVSLASPKPSGVETSSDGERSEILCVRAKPAALNLALSGLTFTPAANFNGYAEVALTLNDGKGKHTSTFVPIFVQAVNDAPLVSVLSSCSTGADVELKAETVIGACFALVDVDCESDLSLAQYAATNGEALVNNETLQGLLSIVVTAASGR